MMVVVRGKDRAGGRAWKLDDRAAVGGFEDGEVQNPLGSADRDLRAVGWR
jgi:hypothetical protein